MPLVQREPQHDREVAEDDEAGEDDDREHGGGQEVAGSATLVQRLGDGGHQAVAVRYAVHNCCRPRAGGDPVITDDRRYGLAPIAKHGVWVPACAGTTV